MVSKTGVTAKPGLRLLIGNQLVARERMVSKSGVSAESGKAGSPCGEGMGWQCSIRLFCLVLIVSRIRANLIWEISSLLCSRNCARKAAEDGFYTILYIASLGTKNRKLKIKL